MAVKKKVALGQMIKDALIEQDRSERWLAKKLGDANHAIINYFIKHSHIELTEERLQKINSILNTDFKQ